ncbi:hypothetical protein SK128_020364 [Halocaridina rubra]|uniref:Cyclin N-terminal domain-containing protein n=1 Tax=Halocaridina rubra TaxID=373956 RepID=A0AAN8XHE6_HALRR
MADKLVTPDDDTKAKICETTTFSSFQPCDFWTDEELAVYVHQTSMLLKAENEREKNEVKNMEVLNNGALADFMFSASEKFKLEPECKYIAMDLFSRFMTKHSVSLVEQSFAKTKKSEKRKKLLKEIRRRMKCLSPLRALTCLMIASKLVSVHSTVTPSSLKDYMKKMECNFSIKQIARSEIRVLEELNFKCFHTHSLMVYIGVLVAGSFGSWKVRIKQEVKKVEYEDVFDKSMKLLDIACLQSGKLYNELFFLATGSRNIPDHLWPEWCPIMTDRLLLAAAAVTAAGWLLGGDAMCESTATGITSNLHLNSEDVVSLTACLLRISGISLEITPHALKTEPISSPGLGKSSPTRKRKYAKKRKKSTPSIFDSSSEGNSP